MKTLANVCLVVAILSVIASIVCRIRFAPIVGLGARDFLRVADTSLLFLIALLLLEKSGSK